jgi:hypothetical protein
MVGKDRIARLSQAALCQSCRAQVILVRQGKQLCVAVLK